MTISPRPSSWMSALGDRILMLVEGLMVAILCVMIVLVFSNVVLRYGFDRGLTVTDELSRLIFVWIAFVGAIATARRGMQISVDLLTSQLPIKAQYLLAVISNLLIIGCCAVLSYGAWSQIILNLTNLAPISGIPLAWTYAAPWLCGIGIGLVAAANLFAAVRALISGAELDRPQ